MADLGVLAQIPGLAGYLQTKAMNEGQTAKNLNDAFSQMGILSQIQARQQEAQMAPLRMQQLQQQIAASKIASDEATRKAAFYSPANLAQFQKPGEISQPGAVQDDVLSSAPIQQAAPKMDFNKMLETAASQGIVNPEIYANHLAAREQAKVNAENARQARKDQLEARLYDIETRSQDRTATREQQAVLAKMADATRRELAAAIQSNKVGPVIQTTTGFARVNPNNTITPILTGEGSPVMPASANRAQNAVEKDLRGKLDTFIKPQMDNLTSVAAYKDFRATGDNAQAMTMAANALTAAARTNNQRFKGEADRLLGSGAFGGSLTERIRNFTSQLATGTPTNETIKKLDRLVEAAEDASLEGMSNAFRLYAGRAKANNVSIQKTIGRPYIQGTKVVFPDGTFAKFKDDIGANAAAEKWIEANQ